GMDWVKKNGLDETQYDPYYMIPSAPEGVNAITRWKNDIYNDFAVRMQWTVCSSFKDANHHPVVVLGEKNEKGILDMEVKAGKKYS
nr:hypothetical protein [Prevotella sp.]